MSGPVTIPLDVLVKAVEALGRACEHLNKIEDNEAFKASMACANVRGALGYHVSTILAAQSVEVAQ